MDVLEPTQNLVHKVSYVIIAETLVLEQLVKVGLHECLYDVDILHVLIGCWTEDVKDINDLTGTIQRIHLKSTHPTYTQAFEHTFS